MKKIIVAFKYYPLIYNNIKLIQKYFSLKDFIVISYKPLNLEIENFVLSGQMSKYWTNDLIKFFDVFDDPNFFIMAEDHFLYSQADSVSLEFADRVTKTQEIDKVFCSDISNINKNLIDYDQNWRLYSKQPNNSMHTKYLPISLLPSVWNTEFFRKILYNSVNFNCWEFEEKNINSVNNLNPKVLVNKTTNIFPTIDVKRRYINSNYKVYSKVVQSEDLPLFIEAENKCNIMDNLKQIG